MKQQQKSLVGKKTKKGTGKRENSKLRED